ncbi:unnamed protein product [Didymodactylos carnosus]|uniref:AAA+ ATPase domain-containing protein n=1 Tax=Didymodactylos carnosus TaxID=1234261 RepID=A0A815HP84_9BILA|nr:unnamed protein product [Didymodactylos carnosus]CAF4230981.1 unnamed protein product [Didymodactylos carnosus]
MGKGNKLYGNSGGYCRNTDVEAARRKRQYQLTIEWDKNVVGQTEAKLALEYAFFLPRRFPTYFKGIKTVDCKKQPPCILFWGPPGTGKTLMAKAVADAHGGAFVSLDPGNVKMKYVGESESFVKDVFDKAKHEKTIIFIDEIDAFMRKRTTDEREHDRSLKTQFLISIDDFSKNMTADSALICATNTKDQLDDSLLRRFKYHLFCDLPDINERSELIKYYLKHGNFDIDMSEPEILKLAEATDLYSGSDIQTVVDLAAQNPVRELMTATHFLTSTDGRYMPCKPDTTGAVQMRLKDIPEDRLTPVRLLHYDDFVAALIRCQPTTNMRKYEAYLKEHSVKNEAELTQQINTEFQTEQEECLHHFPQLLKEFRRYFIANFRILFLLTVIIIISSALYYCRTILNRLFMFTSLGVLVWAIFTTNKA